jgi:regulator of protease activity HflC (stomatin/prohibitin superfamily)
VATDALEEYGIEVVDFGIKKLGLPESVTTAIFESMRSHEEAKAGRYIAEGEATAAKILADARAMEERIMAEARRKASEIETEAEKVVGKYYKQFDEYPELRIFLDKLRTVAEALRRRTTLILDTEESPWDVFNEEARSRVPLQSAAPHQRTGDRAETTPVGKRD